MPRNLSYGVPDEPSSGMAYPYDLGNLPRGRAGRNALAAIREARAEQTQREREDRQAQNDRIREMHENLRDSLSEQTARNHAAATLFQHNMEMTKQQKEEKALQDGANFQKFYGMIKDDDPNRKAQINELFNMFPGAMKIPTIHQMIKEDDTHINSLTKMDITKEEADFLKNHGPGTPNFETTRKQVGDVNDPNHINAVLDFKRAWDLKRKAAGLPSDTAGMTFDQMDQFLTGKQHPQTPAAAPSTAVPPPSTPGPQSVAGWSNANVPAAAPPTATPPPKAGDAWLQGHFKTSENDRDELNRMLDQLPEGAVKPGTTPAPTPKPPPPGQTGPQFSIA